MAFIMKMMHENSDIALPNVPLLLIIFANILPFSQELLSLLMILLFLFHEFDIFHIE